MKFIMVIFIFFFISLLKKWVSKYFQILYFSSSLKEFQFLKPKSGFNSFFAFGFNSLQSLNFIIKYLCFIKKLIYFLSSSLAPYSSSSICQDTFLFHISRIYICLIKSLLENKKNKSFQIFPYLYINTTKAL